MIVKNLSQTSFDTVIDCFLKAFENYFVLLPKDPQYYKTRWEIAKVDFRFSYSMFDKNQLIGFIIHAVDNRQGQQIAFNTGTGVLVEYRGQKVIKKIYDHALPDLKQHGFTHSKLEVITINTIAIKAYEDIGFKICKHYKCFSGNIVQSI